MDAGAGTNRAKKGTREEWAAAQDADGRRMAEGGRRRKRAKKENQKQMRLSRRSRPARGQGTRSEPVRSCKIPTTAVYSPFSDPFSVPFSRRYGNESFLQPQYCSARKAIDHFGDRHGRRWTRRRRWLSRRPTSCSPARATMTRNSERDHFSTLFEVSKLSITVGCWRQPTRYAPPSIHRTHESCVVVPFCHFTT